MIIRRFAWGCAALLLAACDREPKDTPRAPDNQQTVVPSGTALPLKQQASPVPVPTRLTTLPVSAYATTLAMDQDAVYLMTPHAAYRLVEGEPAHGIRLELGIGPALSRSAFVFWSQGAVWSAPKQGGVTRELAKVPHEPQYFVSSGDALAWVDQTQDGLYSIQTLDGRTPKILVSAAGEIRALDLIGDAVYFVQRPSDASWRVGRVRLRGGAPEYGTLHSGRAPSQLAGSDGLYYYDLDRARISKLSLDLRHEEALLKDLVCSPIHVSRRIFCGCVEGLFDVSTETHEPRVLVHDRPGSITSIASNAKAVAWVVDLGPNQLAVDLLPRPEGDASSPIP